MFTTQYDVRMQDVTDLDDVDLRVVNALQINPRASWAQIGAVLEIDPVTAARRWNRLERGGVAWVTAYMTSPARIGPLALVEVDSGGHSLDTAELLVGDPECASIDITSGARDLLLTVTASTMSELADYLLHRVSRIEHVRAVRTHLASRVIAEGSDWRLTKLTEEQVTRLTRSVTARKRPELVSLGTDEMLLAGLLADNGRASTSELAAAGGMNPRKVRDMLRGLLDSGRLTMRTEVRSEFSGWPVYAWFFLRVPAASTSVVSRRLGTLPEIRTVLEIAGPNNLIMAVWLREISDVNKLEADIERLLRDVAVVDRSVVLRTAKRAGAVLDARGSRVRTISMLS